MKGPQVTKVEVTLELTVEDSEQRELSEEQVWEAASAWLTQFRSITGLSDGVLSLLHWTGPNTVELAYIP